MGEASVKISAEKSRGGPSLGPDSRATARRFLTLDSADEISCAGDGLNHQAKAEEQMMVEDAKGSHRVKTGPRSGNVT